MSVLKSKYLVAAGILAGGLAGWLYAHFVGCSSGGCLISSNPYIATLYGSTVGGLLAGTLRNAESKPDNHKKQAK